MSKLLEGVDPRLQYIIQKLGLDPSRITSGYRSPEENERVKGAKHSQHLSRNAIDYSTAGMSIPDYLDLMKRARALGVGGIGVYGNEKGAGSIHLDIGPERAWGSDYTGATLPEWAKAGLVARGELSEAQKSLYDDEDVASARSRSLMKAGIAQALAAIAPPEDPVPEVRMLQAQRAPGTATKRLGVASLYDFG